MKHVIITTKIIFVSLLFALSACNRTQKEAAESDATDSISVQSIVIDIETLEAPKENLPMASYDSTLLRIIGNAETQKETLVAHNRFNRPLVYGEEHPFFNGMHMAYAGHRPFVLSPDAVWLLVCQGFVQHIDHNADTLRPLLVDFEGKKELKVYSEYNLKKCHWEACFSEFTQQIARYTGEELIQTLTADFSTTTPLTRTVSQVTIMSAMKSFFDYTVMEICGIPSVILEGTPEDWQKIADRVQLLRKYQLDWWVDEMEPVLLKIVKASQGEVDKKFWKSMYKVHNIPGIRECGDPKVIADGWVIKFFPYNNRKQKWDYTPEEIKELGPNYFRNDFKGLYDISEDLPAETASVPLRFIDIKHRETRLTLNSGFVGLSQDTVTHALRPEIGWFITQ